MTMFFWVVILTLWALAVCGLGIVAMIQCFEGSMRWGVVSAAGAIVLFALPFGLFAGDPLDPRLCLRGHQEWRTEMAPRLVGKVIVSTTQTRKVWICEQWEAR